MSDKRWGFVFIFFILGLLLSGCGESQPATASATTSSASGSTKDITVAYVPPGVTSPFYVSIRNGAVRVANNLGWQVNTVSVEREDDAAGQVVVAEQQIDKKVNALGISPMDAKAIIAAVKKANSAQIPVFMPNLITPIGEGEVVEYIGYDQWSGAAKLGEYTCKLLNGSGEIFILTGISGSYFANRRTQGYKAALEKNCPAVKIVGEESADWVREKGMNVATNALQQHPNIKLFYGNSDEMDIGACMAASKMGKVINRDIYCIGIDGNPVTLDLIGKGEVTATLGVYPDKIGETMISQIDKYMKGQKVPQILETPSLVVDTSNLADYKAGKTWTEPVEGKPEFDNGKPTRP